MKKNTLNKKVAVNIIKAQIASDAAKNINELSCKGRVHNNYDGKDDYIIRAIKTIIKKRGTGFSFYVTYGDIFASLIVYFNFKLNDKDMQISFHSFNDELLKYIQNNSAHAVEWDQKSSREAANSLKTAIGV